MLVTQAMIMTNFSAVADTVADAFEVSATLVNLCVVVFFISAVAFTFVSVPAIEKNMAIVLRIGGIMTVLGAWLRYFATDFRIIVAA